MGIKLGQCYGCFGRDGRCVAHQNALLPASSRSEYAASSYRKFGAHMKQSHSRDGAPALSMRAALDWLTLKLRVGTADVSGEMDRHRI